MALSYKQVIFDKSMPKTFWCCYGNTCRHDTDTTLCHFGGGDVMSAGRDYGAYTGRWTNRDPIRAIRPSCEGPKFREFWVMKTRQKLLGGRM